MSGSEYKNIFMYLHMRIVFDILAFKACPNELFY